MQSSLDDIDALSHQASGQNESDHESWLEAEYERITLKDPTKQHEFNFYMEYCRLLLANAQLVAQVAVHSMQIERTKQDMVRLQSKLNSVDR